MTSQSACFRPVTSRKRLGWQNWIARGKWSSICLPVMERGQCFSSWQGPTNLSFNSLGIGYFTLPILVHAKARHVHACEWNPNAIHSLKRNLHENKVSDRCTVYEGDNRDVRSVCFTRRIDFHALLCNYVRDSSVTGFCVVMRCS